MYELILFLTYKVNPFPRHTQIKTQKRASLINETRPLLLLKAYFSFRTCPALILSPDFRLFRRRNVVVAIP